MYRRLKLSICLFGALSMWGCPEEPTPPPPMMEDPDASVDETDVRVIEEGDGDVGGEEGDGGLLMDLGPPLDASPPTRSAEYGEPCRANGDCVSGICIGSPNGFLCSQTCLLDEDCPDVSSPMSCSLVVESFGPDSLSVCSPNEQSLCQPCLRDEHCFGGRCLNTPQGNVCGADCDEDGSCPSGAECRDVDSSGAPLPTPQCVPDIALCGCDGGQAGEQRSCARTSVEIEGRCFGQEVCDPELGWSGCDAPTPVPEVCDGVDNDCNGAIDDGLPLGEPCVNENEFGSCDGTRLCNGSAGWSCFGPLASAERCDGLDNDCDMLPDEDFVDAEGAYSSVEHCGACGISCVTRFPLAETTACEARDGNFQCVITECRSGFFLGGNNACLPLTSRLCDGCEQDSDCNQELGDRCLEYGENARFCGRDCSEGSPFGVDCPEGFSCDGGQCRLDVGNCLCSESDSFIIPCSVTSPTDPNVSCVGALTCDRGTLSACELPAESCDLFDDDCDGRVDEDFINPETGVYISDQHCGRCGVDCTALVVGDDLNGVGVCDSSEASPRCALACDEGYADVNRVQADGCECQVIDRESDHPDSQGIDADCDGIDGQVARGLFVSPNGDDTAVGTREAPMRTIQAAIERAGGARDHIYVAAGVYTEQVRLRAGISIFGGYSADYSRRDLRGNETAIFPPIETDQERLGTVSGLNINGQTTEVSGFTIIGYAESRPGRSSYAIYLRDCDESVSVRDNVIRGGSGGAGLRGGSGVAGLAAPNNAEEGAPERRASESLCTPNAENLSAGGKGGVHSCLDASGVMVTTHGGDGGTSDCPVYNEPESPGATGDNVAGGLGGRGGYNQELILSNNRCLCLVPNVLGSTEVGVPGSSGQSGERGAAGDGCDESSGVVVDGHWVAIQSGGDLEARGGSGGAGLPGGGGGGGGAGSGVAHGGASVCNNLDSEVIGGGGGGGGAGGCGGTGGQGGSSGGGSFGVFITFSQESESLPLITQYLIERGFGGAGGDGGEGGEGGEGGLGKEANALIGADRSGLLACADPGGRGGDGGEGGDGGGGGGGCGGISTGVFVHGLRGAVPPQLGDTNQYPLTGAPGVGGRGGLSLGRIGEPGADGYYVEVTQ